MTRDGKYITLHANIELPSEAEKVMDYGATGIGLYRSEFLFFQNSAPSEEEQTEAYKRILNTMAPCPVTIRTLDAGGDKLVEGLSAGDKIVQNQSSALQEIAEEGKKVAATPYEILSDEAAV